MAIPKWDCLRFAECGTQTDHGTGLCRKCRVTSCHKCKVRFLPTKMRDNSHCSPCRQELKRIGARQRETWF